MKRVVGLTILLFTSGIIFHLLIPKPTLLGDYSFSQTIYDRDNQLLRLTLSDDDKYRAHAPLSALPSDLIRATLLQEDQFFYWHPGVNWVSLIRAAWQSFIVGERRVGASTISMQLARLHFGIQSRTVRGKLIQIARALQLEWHYSKDDILEAYLTLAPYGSNIEGVAAASLIYFHKKAKQLTLPEVLTLTVIPQNPSKRTPVNSFVGDNEELHAVRDDLFLRWLRKYPQDTDKRTQFELPLNIVQRKDLPFKAPHLVDLILREHPQENEIVTTLDMRLQNILERQARSYIEGKRSIGIKNAAALLIDYRNMELVAMLGSADFFDETIEGQVNGTLAKRSPGSALKPFIYVLGMDQGIIHPATMLKDSPMSFGEYDPENFDHSFMGPINVTQALIHSRNLPAMQVAEQLEKPDFYTFLQQADITRLRPASFYGLALVLGGLEVTMEELVKLYATLPNRGFLKPIRKIQGEALSEEKVLLSPEASYLTLDILRKNPRPGQGFQTEWTKDPLRVHWKTGTSYAFRDAWSIGIFGPYVLGVWVGNFDGASNPSFVGRRAAAPLMFHIIDAIKAQDRKLHLRAATFRWRSEVTSTKVCSVSGQLPGPFCPHTVSTLFIPGKSPITPCSIHREIMIDRKTGLRMCQETDSTRREVYEFWSSDLLKIFKLAGIPRRMPPPYHSECSLEFQTNQGTAPKITSPKKALVYHLRLKEESNRKVAFMAVADADVQKVHWFLNKGYLGSATSHEPFYWSMKPGEFVVYAVDDHGRSDSAKMRVKLIQ